jgi:hypothetical protein
MSDNPDRNMKNGKKKLFFQLSTQFERYLGFRSKRTACQAVFRAAGEMKSRKEICKTGFSWKKEDPVDQLLVSSYS